MHKRFSIKNDFIHFYSSNIHDENLTRGHQSIMLKIYSFYITDLYCCVTSGVINRCASQQG